MKSKFIFFIAIIALLVLPSCSNDENSSSTNLQTASGVKYSGEDILKGLFFFKNDISDGIPQLAELKSQMQNTNNYAQISKSMDELSEISVNFINTHYPTFFKELELKVYSGNFYEISTALDQASKYVEQAGLSSKKFQPVFLMGKKINEDEKLKEQISKLDLSTQTGVDKLNTIIEGINGGSTNQMANKGKGKCVVTIVAGAVAAVYVGVVAVSIVVAAYSVYFKVAYWGGSGSEVNEDDNQLPLTDYIMRNNQRLKIEEELFIAQTSAFFKRLKLQR